ncbi:uncharacterized protein [Ptychodera flava]|uniref:uncharacterized protein n=1 Tax=Ptychodera flava TaxID=63121 RepID=UPI003969E445
MDICADFVIDLTQDNAEDIIVISDSDEDEPGHSQEVVHNHSVTGEEAPAGQALLHASHNGKSSSEVNLEGQPVLTGDRHGQGTVIDKQSEPFTDNHVGQWPVFSNIYKGLNRRDVLNIIVGNQINFDLVCKSVPTNVRKNATFVVDTTSINVRDLSADDNGIWRGGHSCPQTYVTVTTADGVVKTVKTVPKNQSTSSNTYLYMRHYSIHAESSFKRIIHKVYNNERKLLPLVVIQYYFDDGIEKEISLPNHGNQKKAGAPFYRTKPSTLQNIREKCLTLPPKKVISSCTEDVGGVMGCKSVGDIPRDRRQVYNAKKNITNACKSKRGRAPTMSGDYGKLFTMAAENDFLRSVQFNPQLQTFSATNQQLCDLKRYCGSDNYKCILGIDPTFRLGEFYTTVTTFPHPMFVIKGTDNHPTMLGPIMTHMGRKQIDYDFFCNSLKTFGIDRVVAWGTDGETALINSFENAYPTVSGTSVHLRCFAHVEDDLKKN